ncbi:MAG: hypothetical protein WDN49_11800 [Acetobacteraceae bacterium]
MGERRFHCALGLVIGATGLIASTLVTDPVATMVAFSVAAFGFLGSQPVFWTIPSSMLTGAAAAGGVGADQCGWRPGRVLRPVRGGGDQDATGSYSWGMVAIAGCALVAAVIVVALGEQRTAARLLPAGQPPG